ncbi:hypothetical protein CLIB1423_04S06084 [[Candida] railenensis]|uniref:Oxidoreductase n=1 Tax=[Candida] railenensis TaxID=45579 RepID=A0A9P0QN66_9ASCO|nr:hypothetical protein CLIB1423_04S06084 [[Candida] railenensis]
MTFEWTQVSPDSLELEGKNVTIVGGTGGLGRALSQFLSSRGAAVTVVGQTFRDSDKEGIEFVKSDLSSMKESLRIAKLLPAEKTDILVFTTGIFAAGTREETKEGVERDLAVSYLNRFVMLRELLPRLKSQQFGVKPRIFNMGYPGDGQAGNVEDFNSEGKYKAMGAHMTTVAANEALVYDVAEKHPEVNIFGLNPGLVKTNIRNNFLGENSWKSSIVEFFIGWLSQSPEQYARGIAPLLVTPDIETRSGAIFNNKGKNIDPSKPLTKELVEKYAVESAKLANKVLGW